MYLHESVKHVPIVQIRLDEANLDIHLPFEPQGHDRCLVEDIKANGVLVPLALTAEGKCADGRRRLLSAKHAGLKTVPVIASEGDAAAMHKSAQLGRSMSVFAQCVMFGSEIKNVLTMGRSRTGDSDVVEMEWQRIEAMLGRNRKTLQRGVSLLDRLAAEPENDRQAALFDRVTTTFQRMGLKPALRFMGETGQSETEDEADECEVDQADWVTEEDNDFSDTPKRIRKTKQGSKTDTERIPSDSETVEIRNPEAWAKDIYKRLAGIQKKYDQYGITSEIEGFLNGIEAVTERYASEAG